MQPQVCKVSIHYDNGMPGVLLFKGNRKKVRVGCRTAAEKQQDSTDSVIQKLYY